MGRRIGKSFVVELAFRVNKLEKLLESSKPIPISLCQYVLDDSISRSGNSGALHSSVSGPDSVDGTKWECHLSSSKEIQILSPTDLDEADLDEVPVDTSVRNVSDLDVVDLQVVCKDVLATLTQGNENQAADDPSERILSHPASSKEIEILDGVEALDGMDEDGVRKLDQTVENSWCDEDVVQSKNIVDGDAELPPVIGNLLQTPSCGIIENKCCDGLMVPKPVNLGSTTQPVPPGCPSDINGKNAESCEEFDDDEVIRAFELDLQDENPSFDGGNDDCLSHRSEDASLCGDDEFADDAMSASEPATDIDTPSEDEETIPEHPIIGQDHMPAELILESVYKNVGAIPEEVQEIFMWLWALPLSSSSEQLRALARSRVQCYGKNSDEQDMIAEICTKMWHCWKEIVTQQAAEFG